MTPEDVRKWEAFVANLDRREPKCEKLERKSVPVHNATTAIVKYQPPASSPRVEAVYCRWCGNLFTLSNRPKCEVMPTSYCHSRSEILP